MAVLVTGGAGYIGSHTCIELLNAGESIVVVDNFSNSKPYALELIKDITGKAFRFYEADLRDKAAIERIFNGNDIDCVVHFAGLKAVGESVAKPLEYYDNNITGTLTLCDVMRSHGCKKLVFSSSATVYGDPASVPITESFPLSVTNPYGSTKLMIENILKDVYTSDSDWSIILLRYFNPIGAHQSGKIGENPNGIPNNLMPYICQVAVKKREKLSVFGSDYPTKDGTGVRDYLHVVDLAAGHLCAIKKARECKGVNIYNLGTGTGYSVLEVVKAFEAASGVRIPYEITARRPGDIAECYADASKAYAELGWRAERSLEQMCADSWNFIKNNTD